MSIADYKILAAGTTYFSKGEDLPIADLVILIEKDPDVAKWYEDRGIDVYQDLEISDYGIPRLSFNFLKWILEELKAGRKILVICKGGHGRTGLVLASLIRILEPDIRDPVQAIRERYCKEAIETKEQEKFVRNLLLPS